MKSSKKESNKDDDYCEFFDHTCKHQLCFSCGIIRDFVKSNIPSPKEYMKKRG